MNKIIGSIYNALGKIVNGFFVFLIWVTESLTSISKTISRGLAAVIFIGCSTIFFLPLFIPLLHPALLSGIIIVVLIAALGNVAVSKLRYYQYISTEYLFDMGTYYKSNKTKDNRRDYHQDYKDMQEENRRKAYEEAYKRSAEQRKQQQEYYDRFFEEMFRGAYRGQYQGGQGYRQGSSSNTTYTGSTFKSQYEKACDTLGVSYNADEYDIKLAYRKLAKKYHPDLNPNEDTTVKFQEINSAYEFLNEENIKRYKSL